MLLQRQRCSSPAIGPIGVLFWHRSRRERRGAGFQLDKVQRRLDPDDWKPMKTVGAGVNEIRVRDAAGAFRVIYVARLAEEQIISFEDPGDVLTLLTTARLALFRTIKERPGSITDVAERLHRDRSAVKRDVDELEKVGLVRVNPKVLPGHGLMKEVSVAARQFRLEAQLA